MRVPPGVLSGAQIVLVALRCGCPARVFYDPAVSPSDHERLIVDCERAVAGGVVLGRDPEGRVVLTRGALPGERVVVSPESVRPKLIMGSVTRVESPSPGRVEPPCPMVARGCGGCDLQHASRELQAEMRIEVVRDALGHTGSLGALARSIPVEQLEAASEVAARTTMRLAVLEDGRLGLRRRRSHESLAIPGCLVAHRLLVPTLAEGRFPRAREVTLRASERTGEVLAVVSRRDRQSVVPPGVRVVGSDALRGGARAWITESVDGHDLRISARSFFQSGPQGAAALGRAVARALEGFDARSDRLVDLYGGVGLFTVLLGARRAEVVERSASAVADARFNTAALGASVTRCDVDSWKPSQVEAVVADPAREGLGPGGVAAVVATGARRVALVSCDVAAMARDVSSLVDNGYEPTRVEVVDMFPHTHHVEAVTTLVPRDEPR